MNFLTKMYGQQDWKSIGKGFLIGLAGAMLTYITSYVANLLKVEVPPMYYPFVMMFWTTLTNFVRKAIDGKVE